MNILKNMLGWSWVVCHFTYKEPNVFLCLWYKLVWRLCYLFSFICIT